MFDFFDNITTINDTTVVLRLSLAVILGGAIGLERGRAGRPAGLRTHILVCLGSTLAIMTNQYAFQEFNIGDPTRMAAQVISGIGFLGAGTIIVTGRHQVKGLTTAAGLWATACMGLAIGIGFYKAAIFSCILIAFTTIVLHRLDNFMLSKSKILDIYIEFGNSASITTILDAIKAYSIQIDSIEIVKPSYVSGATIAAIMTLHLKEKKMRLDVVAKICSLEGVEFAEEI
ncbi:MAG: MgtC/SapB transporter [Herbinix sp.]|jgi:putative Mg2+ transporter-C (MgtC) family protein|nr:MgtC/SapB transporter [Herbinix sp.]